MVEKQMKTWVFEHDWLKNTIKHGYLDIDDLLHLVGRAHMQYPSVPIDALLYEAASLIVNAGDSHAVGTHFDRDVASTPHGIGKRGAMSKHACSYFVSLVLQIAVPILIVLALVGREGRVRCIFARG